MKRRVNRAQELIEIGKRKRLNDKPSSRVYEKHCISTRAFKERMVWTISPKKHASEKYILYLHGGGYVNGFSGLHWQFMSNLVTALGCTVVAPDYPLTPEHQVQDTFDMVFPLYEELLIAADSSNLIVMGDSAGGGMGLALTMQARDKSIEQPSDLVLLSPWLDVTMINPDIKKSISWILFSTFKDCSIWAKFTRAKRTRHAYLLIRQKFAYLCIPLHPSGGTFSLLYFKFRTGSIFIPRPLHW